MTGLASPSTTSGADTPVSATTQACGVKRVIVIDPGHGGTQDLDGSSHNNAVSRSGELEKNLTLAFGLSLHAQLRTAEVQAIFQAKGYCEVEVLMTRETDVNVAGNDRIAVATNAKADIFLSIHFNGSADRSLRQIESFYRATSNRYQTNEAADRQLAAVVNDATAQGMRTFDSGTRGTASRPDTTTHAKSIRVLRDPGVGLSGAMCRSALLEVEYISNPRVEELLVTGANRVRNRDTLMLHVARALARAL
ncbi:N-acetylmuramoyl-L-alanine amidase family protein [Sorangium sp. So ce385]|uniref:N-acetylmuramoyl-L-alanine amidase family protein n=1 Tax=Sorangium sp. So ce385 TaxID=3133308 RepID=UPI003F5C231E